MSGRPKAHGQLFFGSLDPQYRGTWRIDDRSVSRGVFRRAWMAASGQRLHDSCPIARARGARGRKAAVLARRPLIGCDHEFEYHEDTQGDYVYTQTVRWLECSLCGAERSATWEDAPTFDDY